MFFDFYGAPTISLDDSYDFIISIAATGEKYRINSINLGNETAHYGEYEGCTRSMSCSVNGAAQTMSWRDDSNEQDRVVLTK
jgi:hypothetical protein